MLASSLASQWELPLNFRSCSQSETPQKHIFTFLPTRRFKCKWRTLNNCLFLDTSAGLNTLLSFFFSVGFLSSSFFSVGCLANQLNSSVGDRNAVSVHVRLCTALQGRCACTQLYGISHGWSAWQDSKADLWSLYELLYPFSLFIFSLFRKRTIDSIVIHICVFPHIWLHF